VRLLGCIAALTLVLACSGPGLPDGVVSGHPEMFVSAAMGGDTEQTWRMLDPRCQATIEREAFDRVIQQFAQVASQRRNKRFLSLNREPSEPGMTRNTYHFEDDRAFPRPRILIVVPTVDETALPCGLSWDYVAATTMRELFETPLVEDKASWEVSGHQTVEIFEIVERPVEEQSSILIIKVEPLAVLEAPVERAPEVALSIARAAHERGWQERFAAYAAERGRTPAEVVAIRFVDPVTFDSYTELVPWSTTTGS
jgi:hypothetical protein